MNSKTNFREAYHSAKFIAKYLIKFIVNLSSIDALSKQCSDCIPRNLLWRQVGAALGKIWLNLMYYVYTFRYPTHSDIQKFSQTNDIDITF